MHPDLWRASNASLPLSFTVCPTARFLRAFVCVLGERRYENTDEAFPVG